MESLSIGEAVEALERAAEDADTTEAPGHGGSAIDGMSVIPGSMCMSCGGSGTTRLMMTKIPYFREILLSSFSCDDCNECDDANSSILDLNRQLIKSDTARILIPSLELEIPPMTQRGVTSTIEGVLRRAARELGAMQPERLVADPEAGLKVQGVITALEALADGTTLPFRLELIDPSGNSFIEPLAPSVRADRKLKQEWYDRSDADDLAIGLRPGGQAPANGILPEEEPVAAMAGVVPPHKQGKTIEGVDALVAKNSKKKTTTPKNKAEEESTTNAGRKNNEVDNMQAEVMLFQVNCPHCQAAGEEQMCIAQIPFFKECVIMAFHCAACGFRNSEIKGGGAIPSRGIEARLRVVDDRDLQRDLLKSDTASFAIPELDLELERGTLGGLYTTVEGALIKVKDLLNATNPFGAGDSASAADRGNFFAFLAKLDRLTTGQLFPFDIVIRDPMANSFIGPRRDVGPAYPDEDGAPALPEDPHLTIIEYARTWDEDEELGLNDIDVGDDHRSSRNNKKRNNLVPIAEQGTPAAAANDDEEDDDDDDLKPQPPKPNVRQVDHPNPNFARGCADDYKPPKAPNPDDAIIGGDDDKPPLPDDCQ